MTRIGTIAYAAQSGLGILAKSFFDHGIVERILILPHKHFLTHLDWYPASQRHTPAQGADFLKRIDVLLLFENAWDCWPLVYAARRLGKRIVMMPMYEYTPCPIKVEPDLYLCPSLLDCQYFQNKSHVFIPVPVEQPWRLRERARHFVHNAGHGGKDLRNGTPELLEAMRYVQSPIKLTVRGQPSVRLLARDRKTADPLAELLRGTPPDPRVTIRLENIPATELFAEGDVFIFPEKFNGLSLPLQEAHASGMLIMAGDRFPMNTWLPQAPLIPVQGSVRKQIAVEFDCAEYDPRAIAGTIDAWYDRDITSFSQLGRDWAQAHSWETLKPRYMEALRGVM